MKNNAKEVTMKNISYFFEPRLYTTSFFDFNLSRNLFAQKTATFLLNELKVDCNKQVFLSRKAKQRMLIASTPKSIKASVLFLLDSCTAEFSGFLLYKELAQIVKEANFSEGFSFMARDEARHSGFLKKFLQNYFLNIDLCFITKVRGYTFLLPKFVFLTAFFSEKIGYWRYITLFRHLEKKKTEKKYYIVKYFEAWCQDERKHSELLLFIVKNSNLFRYSYETNFWYYFFLFCIFISMMFNDLKKQLFFENFGINFKKFEKRIVKNFGLSFHQMKFSNFLLKKGTSKHALELCLECLFLIKNFKLKYFGHFFNLVCQKFCHGL